MNKRFTGAVALGLAAFLGFSACFGGGDNKKSSSGAEGKPIRMSSVEANTLILPGAVRDTGGSDIINYISASLVVRDKDGKLIMEVADSVETQDNINWTVKLKKDWKFTNGEPVNARSFVDSWNYTAKLSNAQPNRDGLRYIDGYTEDGDTELSGLKIVDDYTFTVKLNTPLNDFVERLDDYTFLPLPAAAFKDMEAYGKNPIGAGPYILEDRKNNLGYKLKRNPDYKGYWKAENPAIEMTIYQKSDAAYADYLAGTIDLVQVPSSALSNFKQDSEDRYLIADSGSQSMIAITGKTPGFGFDEAGKLRRKAVSLAINREEIADKIFKGLRKPAETFLPPRLYPQYANLPGSDVLKFNVQKAKELWAQAEAISPYPKDEKIKFAYNGDGSHKDWVDAVVHQLRENLGIENLVDEVFPTFSEFLKATEKPANYAGFMRYGWGYGLLPAENFEMLYSSEGQYNETFYNNPEVDRLIKEGITGPRDQASDVWGKVQEVLLQDLPMIPLYNGVSVYVYGKDVKNVQLNVSGKVIRNRLTRE